MLMDFEGQKFLHNTVKNAQNAHLHSARLMTQRPGAGLIGRFSHRGWHPGWGDWNIWEPAQLEAFWHLSTVCSVFAYSLQPGSFRVTRLAYFSPVLQGQESEPGGKCTTFSDLALDVTLPFIGSKALRLVAHLQGGGGGG